MKRLHIDCSKIRDEAELHRLFAEGLGFPEWYGRNFDALFDCLTSPCETAEITLQSSAALLANPSIRGETLLSLLRDAAAYNPKLIIKTE